VQISLRQRITLITMFCLGVIICIAGVCRVWYIGIYAKSWDFLCTYRIFPHVTHPLAYFLPLQPTICACTSSTLSPSPTNPTVTGHGTVLFVIISIETSIGIICGCLPGCKPLFTKLFPSVFAKSTNASSGSRSRSKKHNKPPSKNLDGQPFPFQIVKEEGFEVRFGDEDEAWGRDTSGKLGTSSSTSASNSRKTEEDRDDAGSGNSREWIMMQKGPGVNVSPV
jgi:hypothetical protein